MPRRGLMSTQDFDLFTDDEGVAAPRGAQAFAEDEANAGPVPEEAEPLMIRLQATVGASTSVHVVEELTTASRVSDLQGLALQLFQPGEGMKPRLFFVGRELKAGTYLGHAGLSPFTTATVQVNFSARTGMKAEIRVKAGHDSDDEGRGVGSLYHEATSLAATSVAPSRTVDEGFKGKLESGLAPALWCGRKFHKAVEATPDKWITFGRKQGSTVLMDKPFVSHTHCKVRWYSQQRRFYIVDSSTRGTYVNDEKVLGNDRAPRELKHGDKIVIRDEARQTHFDFLVDLRPVGIGLTDPREMEEMGIRNRPASVELEKLKAKLLHLQVQMKNQEDEVLEDEKRYYDIEARRSQLNQKSQMWVEEIGRLDKETKVLQDELHERREKWKEKLAELYETNKVKVRPLVELAADKQEQVSHMQMQATELERQIYPERFALAELPDQAMPPKGGDATEDETEEDGPARRKPPPPTQEQSSPDASAQYKSAGYAPTTPAKTPAFEESALMESAAMQDSAAYHEEAVPFVMGLSMKDLFGEDDDDADTQANAAPAEPEAKRQRTDASGSAG